MTPQQRWAANHPEYYVRKRLMDRYGITLEDKLAMIEAQGGRCAICRVEFSGTQRPNVDHCHETGKVRGILCIGCNRALGRLGDNLAAIRRVARYLLKDGPTLYDAMGMA